MHVGEYWQGRMFRQHMNRPWSRAEHRTRYPGWTAERYGSYQLAAIDGAGNWTRNVFQPSMGYDIGFPGLSSGFHLFGGDGATLGCGAWSLAKMHGVDNDPSGTFPPVPTDAPGSPCYSNPMIFLLRGNSEARCEPDLRERYPLTDRFYDLFDNTEEMRTYPELIDLYGDIRFPEFPEEWYNRVFFRTSWSGVRSLLCTPSLRTAETDPNAAGSLEPVPWVRDHLFTQGPSSDAVDRRDALERFVDPLTRSRPFGGEPLRFRDYTGAATADTAVEDCLEVAPAGWYAEGVDPDTYSFDPLCDGVTSPYTGVVNHEIEPGSAEFDLAVRTLRKPEVGPRDGREARISDTPLIRRHPGIYPPHSGMGWFEHTKSTLGCLFMIADRWGPYVARPTLWIDEWTLDAQQIYENIVLQPCVVRQDLCDANIQDALELMESLLARVLALRVFNEYRLEVTDELAGAFAHSGYRARPDTMTFYGKDPPDLRNRSCYTGPIGEPTFNATVAPVGHVFGGALAGFPTDGLPGLPPVAMRGADDNSAELTPVASHQTFYGAPLTRGSYRSSRCWRSRSLWIRCHRVSRFCECCRPRGCDCAYR